MSDSSKMSVENSPYQVHSFSAIPFHSLRHSALLKGSFDSISYGDGNAETLALPKVLIDELEEKEDEKLLPLINELKEIHDKFLSLRIYF